MSDWIWQTPAECEDIVRSETISNTEEEIVINETSSNIDKEDTAETENVD